MSAWGFYNVLCGYMRKMSYATQLGYSHYDKAQQKESQRKANWMFLGCSSMSTELDNRLDTLAWVP